MLVDDLLQITVRRLHPLSHLIDSKHFLRKDLDQEGEEEQDAGRGGELDTLVDGDQEVTDSGIVVRLALAGDQRPDDVDNGNVDVEADLNCRTAAI